MIARRLLELLAIGMIGEAAAGLLRPRRYLLLWRFGPQWYREWLEALAANRQAVRFLCLVELGVGLWLALRETETGTVDESAASAGIEGDEIGSASC